MDQKIYVVMVGGAPMTSLDALMLSLDRFKNALSSDSAKDRFETTLRTIKPSLREVNQFIDTVYSERNPNMSISTQAYTLIIELKLSKEKFLEYIDKDKVDNILASVKVVGTMSAKKKATDQMREFVAYPVTYANGKFIK